MHEDALESKAGFGTTQSVACEVEDEIDDHPFLKPSLASSPFCS